MTKIVNTAKVVCQFHGHIYCINLPHEPFTNIGWRVPGEPDAFLDTYFEEEGVRIVG